MILVGAGMSPGVRDDVVGRWRTMRPPRRSRGHATGAVALVTGRLSASPTRQWMVRYYPRRRVPHPRLRLKSIRDLGEVVKAVLVMGRRIDC